MASSTNMEDEKEPGKVYTYDGHCHCGAVQFKCGLTKPLHAPESDPTIETWQVVKCNCSICHRNGYLVVHPYTRDFKFTKGEDQLGQYRFASKKNPHWFCKSCGSSIGVNLDSLGVIDGVSTIRSINVRMFRDVDLDTVRYKTANGAEMLGGRWEFADHPPPP